MTSSNNLSKIFGINNTENQEIILPENQTNNLDQALKDFDKVRENISSTITLGQMALSDLSALAAASQDDKFYVAFAKLVMAMTMANKTLIDVHDKKMNILPKDENNNTTINNNLYLTTAEFIELQSKKLNSDDE